MCHVYVYRSVVPRVWYLSMLIPLPVEVRFLESCPSMFVTLPVGVWYYQTSAGTILGTAVCGMLKLDFLPH